MNKAIHKIARVGILLLFAAAVLIGCGKEEIKVYRIPKESVQTPAMPHQQAPQWKVLADVPQNWEEKPASGMRVAQYLVKGKNGAQGEVAVMPMVGLKATKDEILAIWRGQLGNNVVQKSEQVKIGADEGELFDLSTEQPPNSELPSRILVAMVLKNNINWFFRISGASNLIEESKADFINYLNSVKITSADQTSQQPPTVSPTPIKPSDFKVPDDWKPLPPAPMTLTRYEVSDGSNSAVISISKLDGDGGGLLPNINRWRGQINLQNISADELDRVAEKITLGNLNAVVVDFTGTNKTGEQTRMVGIIAPAGSFTYFFKMTGQKEAVEKHKSALINFVKNFKF
ncbi:MAG: hypothetical protein ACP5MG_12910 [Verrucomicrobiia bacterium]